MVEEKSIELFITEEESLMLEALAQSDIPYSQRAQAILAVDAGSTLDQAAGVANLKVTQVRFWLGRFRNSRLTVFPESLLEGIDALLEADRKRKTAEGKAGKKKKEKKSKKIKSTAKKEDKKMKEKGKKKKDSVLKDKKKKKGTKSKKDQQKKKKQTKKAAKKKK